MVFWRDHICLDLILDDLLVRLGLEPMIIMLNGRPCLFVGSKCVGIHHPIIEQGFRKARHLDIIEESIQGTLISASPRGLLLINAKV